ncbi:hypothetical protein [Clostridium sp. DL1XJH146]
MKFNVLFIKKRNIIYTLLFLLILLLFIVYLKTTTTKDTFTNTFFVSETNTYKLDLTGDGDEDTLNIITNNEGKYSIIINTNKNSISLEPHQNLNSFGNSLEYWPPLLNFIDINRDNIPEILYQAGNSDNKAIQHIFSFNDNDFNNLLSQYGNILGILDISNNKTPKIISGIISKDSINFSNYVYINDSLSPFTYNKELSIKDSITQFISVVTNKDKEKFQKYLENNISENINQKSLNTLECLNSNDNSYIFENGFFKDLKSNNDGIPCEIEFTCMLRQQSQYNNNKFIHCIYTIIFKNEYSKDNDAYKIISITKL